MAKETTPARSQEMLYLIVGIIFGLLVGLLLAGYAVNGQRYSMMRGLGFGSAATTMMGWGADDVNAAR